MLWRITSSQNNLAHTGSHQRTLCYNRGAQRVLRASSAWSRPALLTEATFSL